MKIILLGLFFFYFTTLFSQTENSKNRYSKINWMTYKKAEHSIWNQIKCLFISEVTAADIIQFLKHRLKIERPDQGPNNSFPSGHSGQDFVAPQVLHNEIKNTQLILAYNGYVFATSSGTLKIVNNKHWLPEVLRGRSY